MKNNLTGSIPSTISNLTGLERLSITFNNDPSESLLTISKLKKITELTISGGGYSGRIPSIIGSLTNLTSLTIIHTKFTGSIPLEIGNLSKLEKLDVSKNKLTSDVPDSVGKLVKLTKLDISGNQITGGWPASMADCDMSLKATLFGNIDFDSSQQLWKHQVTNFINHEVVSRFQVASLVLGAVIGYVDVASDGISAAVFFGNQQFAFFWLQVTLMGVPLAYLATTTPALTPLERICVLFNLSLGIETYNSIKDKTESNLYVRLQCCSLTSF